MRTSSSSEPDSPGLVAAHELTSSGPPGRAGRPGERRQPRRSGLLVLRRAVPRRLPGAAAPGRQGLLRPRLERLAGQRAVRPRRRRGLLGGALGACLRRVRRRGEAVLAARGTASRFLPTVGWAERGDLTAHGHGNSVPRFHVAWGTGTGVVEPFVDHAKQAARDGLLTFYHRHQVDELVVERRRGSRGARHRAGRGPLGPGRRLQPRARRGLRTHRAGRRRHRRRHRRQPRDGPSATGPSASAPRPQRWSPACPPTSTAGCSTSAPAPGYVWSTGTACGTTPRGFRTGTRSGPATASASCPARRRCGSTPSAVGCPSRACPATTPSAPSSTCAPPRTSPATTTPGSSSPRRSSRRSSPCRAPSRTPTSPPRTGPAS